MKHKILILIVVCLAGCQMPSPAKFKCVDGVIYTKHYDVDFWVKHSNEKCIGAVK